MTDILAPKISTHVGRGAEAILVLTHARTMAGDPAFMGSAAECVRLCALKLDAVAKNAAMLLASVRPPERILKRIDAEPPGFRRHFRERMCVDFDNAIAKLGQEVESRRKLRARHAVRESRQAANLKPVGERLAERNRTFALAHEDAKIHYPDPGQVFIKAPRPIAPIIISTGVGSRGTKES